MSFQECKFESGNFEKRKLNLKKKRKILEI